jgi:uncharacterized protein
LEQQSKVITIEVNNLKESTEFYEQQFGWRKSELSNRELSIFQLNEFQLNLKQRAESSLDHPSEFSRLEQRWLSISYNVKSKGEIDSMINSLKKKDHEVIVNSKNQSIYVSDLDGNLWEIAFKINYN